MEEEIYFIEVGDKVRYKGWVFPHLEDLVGIVDSYREDLGCFAVDFQSMKVTCPHMRDAIKVIYYCGEDDLEVVKDPEETRED